MPGIQRIYLLIEAPDFLFLALLLRIPGTDDSLVTCPPPAPIFVLSLLQAGGETVYRLLRTTHLLNQEPDNINWLLNPSVNL